MEAARASLTWRRIDAELAALAFDSAVDQPVSAVRSAGGPRQLTFEAPGLNIEVEVSARRDQAPVDRQLTPPQPARIDIRHAGGITTVDTDAPRPLQGRRDQRRPGQPPLPSHRPLSATRFVTEWVPSGAPPPRGS